MNLKKILYYCILSTMDRDNSKNKYISLQMINVFKEVL